MFSWQKLGKVFDPRSITSNAWLNEYAQAPCTLIENNYVRVYFSCRPKPDNYGRYVSYSSWLDLDRNDLFKIRQVSEKPILSLGDLGTFDEFGVYPVSVIKDSGQVHAFYGGWTRCESVPFNVAIGYAISDDNGKTFNRTGTGPILSYSPDEPFVISGPKIRKFNNFWQLFYIAGRKWKLVNGRPEPVYKIRMATSSDGIIWRKINKDLIESRIEEDEAQASPDVFYSNGIYHMFFCYRYSANYRGKENGYRIGYASSSNLIDWSRNDDKVGIDVSKDGWDSEMISYPHIFELDGTIYMTYLGNSVGRYGFGLAALKGDLF